MSSDQHHHLLHFYNYIYQIGFPSQWNAGQTVPVPKPGGLSSHRCYFRPITLVNCLSKVLEKMVNCRLQALLESSTFYSPVQTPKWLPSRPQHPWLSLLPRTWCFDFFKCIYFTFESCLSLILASGSQLKVKTIKYIILIVLAVAGCFIINIPYHLN